mgnify:CR=1 FL=1
MIGRELETAFKLIGFTILCAGLGLGLLIGWWLL